MDQWKHDYLSNNNYTVQRYICTDWIIIHFVIIFLQAYSTNSRQIEIEKSLHNSFSPFLKGVCHGNLDHFNDSSPPGPLINRQKYFWILFRFSVYCILNCLRNSTVWCTPLWKDFAVVISGVCTVQCASPSRVKKTKYLQKFHAESEFHGVHHTGESQDRKFLKKLNFVMCIPPQSRAPQCANLREVKLLAGRLDVTITAESSSAVCITLQSQSSHC